MTRVTHEKLRNKQTKKSLLKQNVLETLVQDTDLLEQRQELILRKLNIILEATVFFIKRAQRDGKPSPALADLGDRVTQEIMSPVFNLTSRSRDLRDKTEAEMLTRLYESSVYLLAWRQEQILLKTNLLLEGAWFVLRRAKRALVKELSTVSTDNPCSFYSRTERPQFVEAIIDSIKAQFQDEDKVQPL